MIEPIVHLARDGGSTRRLPDTPRSRSRVTGVAVSVQGRLRARSTVLCSSVRLGVTGRVPQNVSAELRSNPPQINLIYV
jgi:hypothetical protein